jgi:E3 ubiquitin-protein ligase HERC2
LRIVANSPVLCRALSTPVWVNFLLNVIADESIMNLQKQIMAARLLGVVIPSWPLNAADMTSFLEKAFRLLGRIGLMCEASNDLHSNNCRVSLTASHSSTLAEELIALIRVIHALPGWNTVLNGFLASKLSLASDLLSDGPLFHIQMNENGGENSLAIQETVMATLSVVGGLDRRPRIGGFIEVDGQIGTICKFTQHSKLNVQLHESGARRKISFGTFKVRHLS